MRYKILIPARFSSSRLDGKPLIKINGKSLIVRTFENICKVFDRKKIVVVTDDQRIVDELKVNNIPYSIISEIPVYRKYTASAPKIQRLVLNICLTGNFLI